MVVNICFTFCHWKTSNIHLSDQTLSFCVDEAKIRCERKKMGESGSVFRLAIDIHLHIIIDISLEMQPCCDVVKQSNSMMLLGLQDSRYVCRYIADV